MNAIAQDSLTVRQQDAYALAESAVVLERARGKASLLARALEHNLELWVAIRTLVTGTENELPADIRQNLFRLSGFVVDATWRDGVAISDGRLDILIAINLHIAEGLLQNTRH